MGLSTSIFTTLYMGIFAPHVIPFLAFLSIVPAAVVVLAVPFHNYVPFVQRSELESEHTYFSTCAHAEPVSLLLYTKLSDAYYTEMRQFICNSRQSFLNW